VNVFDDAERHPNVVFNSSPGSYFTKAFDTYALTGEAERHLADVDFDTFIATGVSGVIAAGVLAHHFKRYLAVVRKHDDRSTHSCLRVEGVVGKRWVFVDDFIATGSTWRRVLQEVDEVVNRIYQRSTTFVGAYLYETPRGGLMRYVPPVDGQVGCLVDDVDRSADRHDHDDAGTIVR